MELTTKQQEVMQLLEDFIEGRYVNPERPNALVVDGFAGTGKSTTVSLFLDKMSKRGKSFAVLTYTGKASQVLQEKGLDIARTIHSFLYSAQVKPDGSVEYILKDINDPYCEFDDHDFIIIDESSFISDKIYQEFDENCKKIIYIGDSYQLSLERTDKLSNPDISLTEPLRFALESPIGKLANDIREQNKLPFTYKYDFSVNWEEAKDYDIIICYKNATREMLNLNYRRNVLGATGYVDQGEKIMFLSNSQNEYVKDNNKLYKIVNGLIITLETKPIVVREYNRGNAVVFKYKNLFFSFSDKTRYIKLKNGQFFFVKYPDNQTYLVHPVTYAYAITCHKSQGSEWNNVILMRESNDPHYLYTGVTRAKENLKLVGKVI